MFKKSHSSGFFHSLNFLRSFQKRFEREPTRGASKTKHLQRCRCFFCGF